MDKSLILVIAEFGVSNLNVSKGNRIHACEPYLRSEP